MEALFSNRHVYKGKDNQLTTRCTGAHCHFYLKQDPYNFYDAQEDRVAADEKAVLVAMKFMPYHKGFSIGETGSL